jgi:hypothetical protein
MQHEQRERIPGADGVRDGVGGGGDPFVPFGEPRPPLGADTVPSEQLWRAAIRAAREAAALAADLRRQLAATALPRDVV